MQMNYTYTYPEFWLNYFEPGEIAFLLIWAYINTPNRSRKEGFFKVEVIDSSKGDEDDQFVEIGTGTELNDVLRIVGYSSGDVTPSHSGDWHTPPEGGEYVITSSEVESIHIFTEEVDESLEQKSISPDSTVTYREIFNLAEVAFENFLEGYFGLDIENPHSKKHATLLQKLPPKLEEKMKKVLEENRDVIRAKSMGKKWNI